MLLRVLDGNHRLDEKCLVMAFFLIIISFGSSSLAKKYSLADFDTGLTIQVSTLEPQQAESLLQEIKRDPNIRFGGTGNYCHCRAHAVSQKLERKGVLTGKVFVMGNLRALNEKAMDGFDDWGWHVAPFVLVNHGPRTVISVIDPRLFDHVVSLQVWMDRMSSLPGTKINKVLLTQRFNYFWPVGGVIKTFSKSITDNNHVNFVDQIRRESWWKIDDRDMQECLAEAKEDENSSKGLDLSHRRTYYTEDQKRWLRGEPNIKGPIALYARYESAKDDDERESIILQIRKLHQHDE